MFTISIMKQFHQGRIMSTLSKEFPSNAGLSKENEKIARIWRFVPENKIMLRLWTERYNMGMGFGLMVEGGCSKCKE